MCISFSSNIPPVSLKRVKGILLAVSLSARVICPPTCSSPEAVRATHQQNTVGPPQTRAEACWFSSRSWAPWRGRAVWRTWERGFPESSAGVINVSEEWTPRSLWLRTETRWRISFIRAEKWTDPQSPYRSNSTWMLWLKLHQTLLNLEELF